MGIGLRRRAVALACLSGLLVAAASCTTPPGPGGGTPPTSGPGGGGTGGRAPVVFVHGFGSSASQWTSVMRAYQSRGYASSQLSAISYNSSVAITQSAEVLAREVDAVRARTGAERVDIVSHSMGSMVAKTCIIIGGCKGKTAHWISIAGVDNGTENEIIIARGTRSNEDVQGRTPLRKQLQDNWNVITEDDVDVMVFWTPGDMIVVPPSVSQQPPPAINRRMTGLSHTSIYSNTTVINESVAFLTT